MRFSFFSVIVVGLCCRVVMVSIRELLLVVGMSDVSVCDKNSDGAVKRRNNGVGVLPLPESQRNQLFLLLLVRTFTNFLFAILGVYDVYKVTT